MSWERGKPETGNLRPELGSGLKPETGNLKPENGQFPCIDSALAAGAVLTVIGGERSEPSVRAVLYFGRLIPRSVTEKRPTASEALADLERSLAADATEANLK